MWIIYVLIGLFLIVLAFYLFNLRQKKSISTSVIQRNKLEVMLEKELKPRLKSKEEEEKEDFRYRDDYNKNLRTMGSKDILRQEYEQILKGGISKYKAKDYDGAELEFSRIIDSDTANAAAYYYRGLIKNQREDYLNAINDFDLALAYGFQESDLYLRRGLSSFHLKQYEKASVDLSNYLALNPDNTEAHFNKGLSETALNDYPSAIAEFSKIIEINPNFESAYFERGKIYLQMHDKQSACKDFQEAFKKGCLPAHHYLKTICNNPEGKS